MIAAATFGSRSPSISLNNFKINPKVPVFILSGAPLDLMFQSIGGTEEANRGFGITLKMLEEARDATLSLNRGTVGTNVMYFETGQGGALSSNSHHGLDMQTAEARAYTVARKFEPLLVNTVVGFIGPEYLYDGKQIIRAGLEDHFCGKLLGLPMGCDVCYTNHSAADEDDMHSLRLLLATSGCTFFMGIPGTPDDPMLAYQSTSSKQVSRLRKSLGLRPAPEFEEWMDRMDLTVGARLSRAASRLLLPATSFSDPLSGHHPHTAFTALSVADAPSSIVVPPAASLRVLRE